MNRHDTSEERMGAAFRARLDAAQEPSDAVFARTMAVVGAQPASRASRWQSAARWWGALAAPARFATAAAIVIVGGTIAFGTVKTHERITVADRPQPARVTLDRRPAGQPRLARYGSMQLAVNDVASTARRIGELVQRERGQIVSQTATRAPRTTRLLLRVRANRLDATMNAISALGAVDSRHVETADLAGTLDDVTRGLLQAQSTARALRAAAPASGDRRLSAVDAEIARLIAQRGLLEQRIATATVAIVLRAADPNRTAFTAVQRMRSELLLIAMRRTDIPLARGSRFATDSSLLAEHRLRPFHLASSYALADRSRAGRTTTGRNDNTRRV